MGAALRPASFLGVSFAAFLNNENQIKTRMQHLKCFENTGPHLDESKPCSFVRWMEVCTLLCLSAPLLTSVHLDGIQGIFATGLVHQRLQLLRVSLLLLHQIRFLHILPLIQWALGPLCLFQLLHCDISQNCCLILDTAHITLCHN